MKVVRIIFILTIGSCLLNYLTLSKNLCCKPLKFHSVRSDMFIVDNATPLLLRSEERQPHRISGRTDAALPNGAGFLGEFVTINMSLLRSEDNAKARVGFVLLLGALQ